MLSLFFINRLTIEEDSNFWLVNFCSYSLEAASSSELTLENVLGVFSAFRIRKCYLHLGLLFPF